MIISYDEQANAVYVRFVSGKVADTIEIEPGIVVDVDPSGRPLGVEFIYASDFLPFIAQIGGRLSAGALAPLTEARQTA